MFEEWNVIRVIWELKVGMGASNWVQNKNEIVKNEMDVKYSSINLKLQKKWNEFNTVIWTQNA